MARALKPAPRHKAEGKYDEIARGALDDYAMTLGLLRIARAVLYRAVNERGDEDSSTTTPDPKTAAYLVELVEQDAQAAVDWWSPKLDALKREGE